MYTGYADEWARKKTCTETNPSVAASGCKTCAFRVHIDGIDAKLSRAFLMFHPTGLDDAHYDLVLQLNRSIIVNEN